MKEKFLNALQDKDFSELFKKGGISFLMRFAGQIMGFIITFIIARYFGASGLGDYVLSIIVLRIFVLFAKLGMDTASIRFIAQFAIKTQWINIRNYRRKVVSLLIFTSLLASVCMYWYADVISVIVGTKEEYIRLNSFFVFPMAFFILNYQSLRGLKRINEFSFFYWLSRVAFSAIIILIAVQFSQNRNIPIFAFLSSLVLVSILAYLVFLLRLKQKSSCEKSSYVIIDSLLSYKSILIVSLPLLFAQTGQFVMAWTDKLMLGGFTSSVEVGVYDIAFKLSMIANIALTAITSVTAPKFAELFAIRDFKRLEKVVNQSTKIIFWSSLPVLILLLLFSNMILEFFGEEFQLGKQAFYLLSLSTMISAFSGPAGNILQMTGRQVMFMKVLFAGAIINIVLNYFLIPLYGIEGAAFASMTSVVFWNLTMVYFVKKEFGFLTIYNPFKK